jgi:3'-phosphoadenosine 5'-phosphosulfate sulfotransferase (PAPS reductase)/FAD synthetase
MFTNKSTDKHTIEQLKHLQSMSLDNKILKCKEKLWDFYEHNEGNIAISFSGGKDSTVLLDIARQVYPDIKAVFCNTGLEYPEIVQFVKSYNNIEIIRPDMSFKDCIDKCGFTYPSKEISRSIAAAKNGSQACLDYLFGTGKASTINIKDRYTKWNFLLESPFKISDRCCYYIKKKPFKKYSKETGRKDVIGTLAIDSELRTKSWLRNGCNIFIKGKERCRPLSVWTEQDILQYIYENKLPIASVYGDVIKTPKGYKTTRVNRTGCVFCPIGVHLNKPNQFQLLKQSHPRLWEYAIYQLGLGDFFDWINENYRYKKRNKYPLIPYGNEDKQMTIFDIGV